MTVSDNFLLKKNRGPVSRRKGLTINWSCVNKECYFRATTVEGQLEFSTGFHNHQENVEKFLKRENRVKLKKAVAASDVPLAEVLHNLVDATEDKAVLAAKGSDDAMKQCARRFRIAQRRKILTESSLLAFLQSFK